MKKIIQILNGIAFVGVVFINYLSNTGILNNTTIGEISRNYRTLFTPAGYAFSIWGLIYLLLFGFAIYQVRSLFVKVKEDNFVEKIGFWFIISCIANSAWVFAWIYEFTGLSCICIFLLLFSLLKIVINNSMQMAKTSFATKLFMHWPFVIYSGWVTVASVANIAAYLVKLEWEGFGVSPLVWTIVMIAIATLINVFMVLKRNMFAFAFVGTWALIGIGVANTNGANNLDTIALSAAIFLVVLSVFKMIALKKHSI
ncbi:tryptophan-rich sensory protein [uncultured Polaribacter sp.]|uniref:tryptophan-rich sensory protein n=1 Tax=uncultured Polaribacter sp. TaxID=174711 RepID=UPI002620E228|nr:tryptophan-rich sensory protein [uncultured Polaribacter sp.]